MPDTPSVTLVKRMPYRGVPEEWSNTYHFTGSTPADEAEWRALVIAIHNTERAIYAAKVVLVQAYGYAAGNETSVAQMDYRTGANALRPGTNPGSNDWAVPGDAAVMMRAKIGTSSSGKKVYVRKYFHGSFAVSDGNADTAPNGVIAAMNAHGAAMLAGGLPGGAKWSGPQGQEATLPLASPYVTTRTLKRRGKRPTPG